MEIVSAASKLFRPAQRGEMYELKADLNSTNREKVKDAVCFTWFPCCFF